MIKRISLLFLFVVTILSCTHSEKYTIKGNVPEATTKKVYLKELIDGKAYVIDSSLVVNGVYEIEGNVNKATPCFLFEDNEFIPFSKQFYVENIKFEVRYDASTKKTNIITECGAQKLYHEFLAMRTNLDNKQPALNERYAALKAKKDKLKEDEFDAGVLEIRNEWNAYSAAYNKELFALIDANLSSMVAADIFFQNFRSIDLKEARKRANTFTGNAGKSKILVNIIKKIDNIEASAIGQPAPDFTMNTPEGNPLTLSSFKGKVVILDFWASWCRPCREENPNVVKIYKKYHPKGLEIISVSLDLNKKSWIKAIEKDGLIWNHVSDLKKWNSEVVALYGVDAVPHIVIIDKDGCIVARKLRGEAIEKKIAELINY